MFELILRYRRHIVIVLQLLLIAISYFFAFVSRFEFSFMYRGTDYFSVFIETLPVLILIRAISYWHFDLFKGLWKYVSVKDLNNIVYASLTGTILFAVYLFVVIRIELFPRSVLLIDFAYNILLFGGIRMVVRVFRENRGTRNATNGSSAKNILIVGAGDAGEMILREMMKNRRLPYNPIGFVDDDRSKLRNTIHGYPVYGTTSDIPGLVKEYNIDEMLIAIPSATGEEIIQIVDLCRKADVSFKTLPFVTDLIDGMASLSQVREVDIEDLLGRDPVSLDMNLIANELKGKTVMISGAAGSIGSELVRQVSNFSPEKIVLFERSENDLYHLEMELNNSKKHATFVPYIGDIRDRDSLNLCMRKHRPNYIFHAAAYKHVPIMEMNPIEAVKNNILGTWELADMASHYEVEKFVLISTDKAVRPANVMGATKRVAELICKMKASEQSGKTQFVSVRFGNVLGSNGSVIPLFKKQIADGGPITVTHPEIKRYFMTIPEAVQLVVQAGTMGKGGELFLLEMGEAVKIKDLAENLIRLSGLAPGKDIDIIYSGLRPGEKLYEELMNDGESIKGTGHDKIRIIQDNEINISTVYKNIELLREACTNGNIDAVITILKILVPDYKPSSAPNTEFEQIYDYQNNKDNVIIH